MRDQHVCVMKIASFDPLVDGSNRVDKVARETCVKDNTRLVAGESTVDVNIDLETDVLGVATYI